MPPANTKRRGRADFRRQVAKTKVTTAKAGLKLADMIQTGIEDPETDLKVRDWLKRLARGDEPQK